MVGLPFIKMHINEFIEDVNKIEGVEWMNTKAFDNKIFKTQVCTLKNFIKYFKNKANWLIHI